MAHEHATASSRHSGTMKIVLGITTVILFAELVGAYFSHSLVLLADAGHMLADASGIALALFATYIASRPPTGKRTFGLQRAEILAATFNALLLLALSGYIIIEAIKRLMVPPEVEPSVMIVFGIVALIGNGTSLFLLREGQKESLNVKGAFLEVLSDLLGAAAVIVAAVVIMVAGWHRADAVASLVIGVLIVPRTLKLLSEALDVLLEATPRSIDLVSLRKHLLEVPGVVDLHDVHAWLITSGVPIVTAHIVVAEHDPKILDRLQDCLSKHFGVEHSTFQIEPALHSRHEHVLHD